MNAIEILQEELSDMPKPELSKKEMLDKMLADTINPKQCKQFRRQLQSWKVCCHEGELAIADGANEWVIWSMVKRHLENVVGWYATTELGREAGESGYRLCCQYWFELGTKVEGPQN